MGGCYPHPYGDEDFSSFDSSEDLFDSEDFEMKPYEDEEDSKDYYATGKCKECCIGLIGLRTMPV